MIVARLRCWLVTGVDEASRVLEWAEKEYPDSALFLYFKSRILRLQVCHSCDNDSDCSESLIVDISYSSLRIITLRWKDHC